MPTFRSNVLAPAGGMSQRVVSSAASAAPAPAPTNKAKSSKPVAGPTKVIERRQPSRGSSSWFMDIALFCCLIYIGHFYVAPAVGPILADALVRNETKTAEDAVKSTDTASEAGQNALPQPNGDMKQEQPQNAPPQQPATTPKPFTVLCTGKYRVVHSGYLEQECAKLHLWAKTCAPQLQVAVHGIDSATALNQSFDATVLHKLPVEPLPWMGTNVVLDVGAETDSALVPRPIPKALDILVHTDEQQQIIPTTRKVYFAPKGQNPQKALLQALGYPHSLQC